jgi:L-fuconolactonase
MIGSDWPVCTVAGSYSQVMNLVIDYLSGHSAAVREAILGANAERLWNLSSRLARPDRIS